MISPLDDLWRTARRLKQTRSRRGPKERRALPPLLFFTDPVRVRNPEAIVRTLPRGSAVVYRAFGRSDAVALGRQLARAARRRGVLFIVGADAGLAVTLRADGVHLPERLTHHAGVNRRLAKRFLLTAAAHSLPAARRAWRGGVDALVISPVFASNSPSAGRPLGILRFAHMVRSAGAPVYALGGVSAPSARRLRASGAMGLAAIDAFIDAPKRAL